MISRQEKTTLVIALFLALFACNLIEGKLIFALSSQHRDFTKHLFGDLTGWLKFFFPKFTCVNRSSE